MRKIIIILLTALFPLCMNAQEELKVVRGNCLPDVVNDGTGRRAAARRLPARNTEWDNTKTYKQLVVLVEFSDVKFSEKHSREYYDSLFNHFDKYLYEGKARYGNGSVADYYRDQSGGLLNLEFDIVGPYQVTQTAKTNDKYKRSQLREATVLMVADQNERDFSQYNWNNDAGKAIEQVIYVCAGLSGNITGNEGYLHPNTSSFSTVTTGDGHKISNYSASTELFTETINCGIGTICHEFTHSLGLPDIYPANGSYYSSCDEWDLMDGGNFTNWGWCPPNFTCMEKYLMGWLDLTDLTDAMMVSDLKPVAEGGNAYRVKHSDSEWLLLENRQQSGWDLGTPGKGLVIYHVNYDGSVWSGNAVNNDKTKQRFYIVPADNRDYDAWTAYLKENNLSTWANSPRMNNRHLSTSPYPYVMDGEVLNNELTDTSTPASVMHYPEGALLGKPITNIRMSEDGLVSFDFMGGNPSGIKEMQASGLKVQECYDLQGRRVDNPQRGCLYIVRTPQGIRKQIY